MVGVALLLWRTGPLFRFDVGRLEKSGQVGSPFTSVYLWIGLGSMAPSVISVLRS
jgi:hypothetical protein